MPGDRCTPVMPDHRDRALFEPVHRRLDITTYGEQVVIRDIRWSAALPIAAHFRNHYPVTRLSQRLHLVAP